MLMESGGEKVSLPYANAATKWGIEFERTDDAARIVLPPVPRIRNLSKGYLIGGPALLALVILYGSAGIRERDSGWLIGIGFWSAPLLILIAFAARRLRER